MMHPACTHLRPHLIPLMRRYAAPAPSFSQPGTVEHKMRRRGPRGAGRPPRRHPFDPAALTPLRRRIPAAPKGPPKDWATPLRPTPEPRAPQARRSLPCPDPQRDDAAPRGALAPGARHHFRPRQSRGGARSPACDSPRSRRGRRQHTARASTRPGSRQRIPSMPPGGPRAPGGPAPTCTQGRAAPRLPGPGDDTRFRTMRLARPTTACAANH